MSDSAGALHLTTPEAVSLDLEIAGLGFRALAWLVDASLIFVAWFTVLFAITVLRREALADVGDLGGWVQALLVLGVFVTNWCYGLAFETLWQGQTPGKRLLGIRVVRRDGSPATALDLALRNLCRAIDFLPALYAVGMISMVVTERSRRIGDLVAGTVVVRERELDLSRYEVEAPHAPGGQAPLPAEQLELVLEFLQRANTFDAEPRARLAVTLARAWAQRLPEAERAGLADAGRAEAFLRMLARGEA
jgi:uncharacterized RDD family membrane protein YckC